MLNEHPKAVVSAILFKKEAGGIKIFIQTRWKPKTSPNYSGMLEIPAGAVDSYENVYDAVKREVKEETDLNIVRIVNDYCGNVIEPRKNDKAFVFKPFICQQVLQTNNGLPWVGFVFLCEVSGEVKIDESEAKDPRWVSIEELKNIITTQPENIFPLQLPVLTYFIDNFNIIF
jgi:8-oxo-dGTP pyrophosphatase MutT (NUDIX family)